MQELQQKTTNNEFLEWRIFLMDEQDEATVDHYYYMQIAKEIRATRLKPAGIKKSLLKHFKITFKRSNPSTKEKVESTNQSSKAAWLNAVGLSRFLKKKKKK